MKGRSFEVAGQAAAKEAAGESSRELPGPVERKPARFTRRRRAPPKRKAAELSLKTTRADQPGTVKKQQGSQRAAAAGERISSRGRGAGTDAWASTTRHRTVSSRGRAGTPKLTRASPPPRLLPAQGSERKPTTAQAKLQTTSSGGARRRVASPRPCCQGTRARAPSVPPALRARVKTAPGNEGAEQPGNRAKRRRHGYG